MQPSLTSIRILNKKNHVYVRPLKFENQFILILESKWTTLVDDQFIFVTSISDRIFLVFNQTSSIDKLQVQFMQTSMTVCHKNTYALCRRTIMTSINIDKDIHKRLKKLGIKGSTWNDIMQEIVDHCERCDIFWYQKE